MQHKRFAPGVISDPLADEQARCVIGIINNEDVALDNHIVRTAGIDVDTYLNTNPVIPFCHQTDELPVGRMVSLEKRGTLLIGTMQFADAATYPFADTVYRLIKGGFLNATSIGWIGEEYERANDPARPGGLNFTKSRLLEVSVVPVPANPGALITARATGIDTGLLSQWAEKMIDAGALELPRTQLELLRREARMPNARQSRAANSSDWKCGAARDLDVDTTASWDGSAAAGRMLDAATAEGKIDAARASKGFLLYDAGNDQERGAYKEPFADIVDGKLVAVASGIRAAASRLPDVKDVPEAETKKARDVLDGYEAKMTKEADDGKRSFASKIRALAKDLRQRGLFEVSMLCDVVAYADYVCCNVEQEAADEGDGSPIPARMRAWVNEGNEIIAAMAAEETAENIAGTQDGDVERQVARGVERALSALGLTREGKRLSKDSRAKIQEAHGHASAVVDTLGGLLDDTSDGDDPENPDGSDDVDDLDGERALRARKARARALKNRLPA